MPPRPDADALAAGDPAMGSRIVAQRRRGE